MSEENVAVPDSVDTEVMDDSPGVMLQQAREKSGRTLESIAIELNITVGKLRALEADEYDKLASNVFALGYIKRCAKILGIDEKEIADRFNQLTQSQGGEEQDSNDNIAVEVSPSVKPQLLMPAVVFGVAVLILIGVFALSTDEPAKPLPTKAALVEDFPRPSEVVEQSTLDAEEVENSERDTALPVTTEQPAEIAETVLPNLSAEDIDVVEPLPEASGETTVLPASDVAVQEDFNVLSKKLSFTFTEDCWLKITNGAGEVIHAQLQTAGSSIVVDSIVPAQVMLGNARVVSLNVDGELFTINPLPGRDTIKFVVD